MSEVVYHPAADLFPLMEGAEFDALVSDIATNGLQEPIWRDKEKRILDGRNRHRACMKAKAVPQYQSWTGSDPVAFVLSRNLHRRHLNESQRAMVAAKLANLPAHRPKEVRKSADLPPVTEKRAATMLNVGERTVQHARVVQEKGVPELVRAVERGEVAVTAAAAVARLPEAEQKRAVERKAVPQTAKRSAGQGKAKGKGKVAQKTGTHLDQALREARAWMVKWSHLSALAPVFDAITALIEENA